MIYNLMKVGRLWNSWLALMAKSLSVKALLDKALAEVMHFSGLLSDDLEVVGLGELIAAGISVVEGVISVDIE